MPDPEAEETVTIIRRLPLEANGTCTKCLIMADNESMQCFGCSEYFHAINCPPGNAKGQVTRTFFGGWDNMIQNYSNIQYICDACLNDKKLKNDIIVSNRMCVIEEEMRSIKDTVNDRFNELQTMMKTLVQKREEIPVSSVLPAPNLSYADKVKSTSSSSVIVIKKKRNGPSADIEKIHLAAVNTNASVSNAYSNHCGDTVVVLENQESKDSLLPVLQQEMDSEQFEVVAPAPKLPTITIINITRDYTKEDLLERVKSQNASKFSGINIDETSFKIIYMRKHVRNDKLFKAVVRVSNEIRYAMEKAGDKVNIGLSSCPVFDEYFVKRCNHCQRFNHWKNDCPMDKPVCGRCGGEHDTRVCDSEVVKCCNCVQAKFTNTAHETSSRTCKSYTDAQLKVKSTINYYKRNNLN